MGILDRFKKNEKPQGSRKEKKQNKKQEPKKESNSVKKVSKVKARIESRAYKVLLHPQVSEKATYLGEKNKYVFIVSKKSTKKDIKQAIEDVYAVEPVSIRTINILGKKRKYGKTRGKTSNYKKAIITLLEGQTIQVHEGV